MYYLMMNGNSRTVIADYSTPSRWPRTLAGIRAYLPCNRLPSSAGTYSGSSGEEQRAWRFCDRKGLWAEDDYSRCQFQKDVTRFLYVINQVCVVVNETVIFCSVTSLTVFVSILIHSFEFVLSCLCPPLCLDHFNQILTNCVSLYLSARCL